MGLIPATLGTRPRLAIEIRPEGVVAARAEDAQALVSAVAQGVPAGGVAAPGLKNTQMDARRETVAAVRKALETVALRERQTTLVLPDSAVRVLLLDFDSLPTKAAEALPVVRFRLKKLLPFDADDAVVSYQVMSQTRAGVRVLAVAVPKAVLAEYEGMIREAGFEPGAVLPSTLAAVAGMQEMEAPQLLVNADDHTITTAIVQAGVVLLHRTVDLALEEAVEAETELLGAIPGVEVLLPVEEMTLPLVDRESSAGEWAQQKPLSGYGVLDDYHIQTAAELEAERLAREIDAEFESTAEADVTPRAEMLPALPASEGQWEQRLVLAAAREMTQALSVAAAYFEDTLQTVPGVVLAAGTIGADVLDGLLREAGFLEGELRVRELVEPSMLVGGAVTTRVPHGWMAGVRGALRS